jgi:ABC-2 type transport system ATP-binding protein
MTRKPTYSDRDPAISVRGLRRSYGSYEAVSGVDLDVATGTITALLGTNGAGKTSTLEVVEGLSRPTAGTVRVLGLDPVADRAELRRRCGILLQRSGFSGDLTVGETLQQWAAILSTPRPLDEALEMLRLAHRRDVRVSSLSGGETRRLDIACALMGRPEVVFLDEPTTGLDPESRRDLWGLVRGLRDEGATVVLCTHYLEEAESLADRLEIMHGGRIVRSGSPAEIADGHASTISFLTPAGGLPALDGADLRRVVEDQGTTTLETDDLQRTLTVLLGAADRDGLRLERLTARTASLESVFLEIADSDTDRGDDAPRDDHQEVAA